MFSIKSPYVNFPEAKSALKRCCSELVYLDQFLCFPIGQLHSVRSNFTQPLFISKISISVQLSRYCVNKCLSRISL